MIGAASYGIGDQTGIVYFYEKPEKPPSFIIKPDKIVGEATDISANDASFNSLFINGNITSTGIDVDKITINAPVVVTSQSVNNLATFSINETNRAGVNSNSTENFVASFRPKTGNDAYILVRGEAGNMSEAGIFFGTPSDTGNNTGKNKCAIIAQEQNGSTNSKNDLHFCFSDIDADATITDSKVVIDSDGNVGIGATSPDYKLDVNGQVRIGDYIYIKPYNSWVQHNQGGSGTFFPGGISWTVQGGANGYGPGLAFKGAAGIHFEPTVSFGGSTDTPSDYKAYIKNNGDIRTKANIYVDSKVGIGTTSPRAGLEVTTTATTNNNDGVDDDSVAYLRYDDISSATWDFNSTNYQVSIIGSGLIYAARYVGASDTRIKKNIVEINDEEALQKLRDISCCWYEYIDKVKRYRGKTLGFIAQQVKTHLPEAVSIINDFLPDEMKKIQTTWNNTKMSSNDLQDVSGVKYKFYVSNDISGNEKTVELVGDENNCFTFKEKWENVFCYGKEVNDFHTLDKQKLFALNFSATQEIDKIQQSEKTKLATAETKLATAETEITRLKQQVSVLQSGYSSIMSRLKELERKI